MRIPTIAELQMIRCRENGDPLVKLDTLTTDILSEYRRQDSEVNEVLVRKQVADKLNIVQQLLKKLKSTMQLLVVEGYRSPFFQEYYYLKQLLLQCEKDPKIDFLQLLEKTHQLVALPSIAGHPTGGAVDLTIVDHGKEVDMGGRIADFSIPELLPTFSPSATPEQAKNRLLLHDLMLEEGFAPFYGEWWHFSYGDREWAAFHGLPETFYSPLFHAFHNEGII